MRWKKGYSGTAIFTKKKPLTVAYGIGIEEHDQEGRVITLEYENFYMVTVYTPNSQSELARLDYRMKWEDDFRAYLKKLDEKKACNYVWRFECGTSGNRPEKSKNQSKKCRFYRRRRGKFTEFLESGFTDTFRYFYPEETGIYSWWSYRLRPNKERRMAH